MLFKFLAGILFLVLSPYAKPPQKMEMRGGLAVYSNCFFDFVGEAIREPFRSSI